MTNEDDVSDLWPGMLGVCLRIPTRFVTRNPDDHRSLRDRHEKAFVDKLDRVVKEFNPGIRAQIQDAYSDPWGFYRRDVMLWAEGEEGAEVDHNELRRWLHERSYVVLYATYHYQPAMA